MVIYVYTYVSVCVCMYVYNYFKILQGSAKRKHKNKMIDVMRNSFENLITLCKCKVIFYILMQISESVIGTHSK